ncbi:siroheme synthase middle domains-like protein [Atractiella rhizophila]|nr:siroheme synthase middle domains-like protein [Atractiella rhizophila]
MAQDTHDPSLFPSIPPSGSLLLAYRLPSRRVLIVGGGLIAASRLRAVLGASALVTVVSPSSTLCSEMTYRIHSERSVDRYEDRSFVQTDLDAVDMVLVCDEVANTPLGTRIFELCRERRIVVNVADVPEQCDFWFGSTIRRGPLQVLVSTGGKGPRLAHHIRRRIEDAIPENVDLAIEGVGKVREKLRERVPGKEMGLVKARMEWMSELCDRWSLEELAELEADRGLRETVLLGWNDDPALRYVPSHDAARSKLPVRLMSVAVALGEDVAALFGRLKWIAVGSLATILFYRYSRRP